MADSRVAAHVVGLLEGIIIRHYACKVLPQSLVDKLDPSWCKSAAPPPILIPPVMDVVYIPSRCTKAVHNTIVTPADPINSTGSLSVPAYSPVYPPIRLLLFGLILAVLIIGTMAVGFNFHVKGERKQKDEEREQKLQLKEQLALREKQLNDAKFVLRKMTVLSKRRIQTSNSQLKEQLEQSNTKFQNANSKRLKLAQKRKVANGRRNVAEKHQSQIQRTCEKLISSLVSTTAILDEVQKENRLIDEVLVETQTERNKANALASLDRMAYLRQNPEHKAELARHKKEVESAKADSNAINEHAQFVHNALISEKRQGDAEWDNLMSGVMEESVALKAENDNLRSRLSQACRCKRTGGTGKHNGDDDEDGSGGDDGHRGCGFDKSSKDGVDHQTPDQATADETHPNNPNPSSTDGQNKENGQTKNDDGSFDHSSTAQASPPSPLSLQTSNNSPQVSLPTTQTQPPPLPWLGTWVNHPDNPYTSRYCGLSNSMRRQYERWIAHPYNVRRPRYVDAWQAANQGNPNLHVPPW